MDRRGSLYVLLLLIPLTIGLSIGCAGTNPDNPTEPPLNLGKIAGQVMTSGDPKGGVEVVLSGSKFERKAFTNEMGYFVMDNLSLGRYEITINAPGYEEVRKDVVVRPGKVVYLGRIELKPLATIKGQVLLWGDNFSGTDVVVVELERGTVTDRHGNFVIQVPEGEYRLKIRREGFLEKEVRVKALSGKVTEIPLIRLSPRKAGVRSEPDDSIFVGGNPFAEPKVHIVKFYFSNEAVATLRRQNSINAPRIDVPGRMIIDDEVFEDVAVHLRGYWGSFRPFDDKPGLRVDLNKFVPGQRYHGLAELSFHNSVQDPSYICEYIGYYMWRLAGIPAPEVTWAKVYINDVYKGLYYIKEVVDKDFLKRWFYNPEGNLYKAIPGPLSDFNNPSGWELHTNVAKADTSDLVEVANVINRAQASQLMDLIWDYVDQDNYITNWAMEDLTNHWDGYIQNTFNNNHYIYHDPLTGRFYLIPHGTDQLFQGGAWARPGMRSPVALRLYQDSRFRDMLRERRLEILRTVWDAEKLCAKIDEIRNILRKGAGSEINAGEGRVQEIKNFLRSRPSIAANWPP